MVKLASIKRRNVNIMLMIGAILLVSLQEERCRPSFRDAYLAQPFPLIMSIIGHLLNETLGALVRSSAITSAIKREIFPQTKKAQRKLLAFKNHRHKKNGEGYCRIYWRKCFKAIRVCCLWDEPEAWMYDWKHGLRKIYEHELDRWHLGILVPSSDLEMVLGRDVPFFGQIGGFIHHIHHQQQSDPRNIVFHRARKKPMLGRARASPAWIEGVSGGWQRFGRWIPRRACGPPNDNDSNGIQTYS